MVRQGRQAWLAADRSGLRRAGCGGREMSITSQRGRRPGADTHVRGSRLRARWWVLGMLALVLVLAVSQTPVQASGDVIALSTAGDLMLPASQIPTAFIARPDQSGPLTDATLRPVLGVYMLRAFHQDGLIAG